MRDEIEEINRAQGEASRQRKELTSGWMGIANRVFQRGRIRELDCFVHDSAVKIAAVHKFGEILEKRISE